MNDAHKDFNVGDLAMIRRTYITEILYRDMLDIILVVSGFNERNNNDFTYDKKKTLKTYVKLSLPSFKHYIWANPDYIIKL